MRRKISFLVMKSVDDTHLENFIARSFTFLIWGAAIRLWEEQSQEH